jgi:DNA-binding transcriptional MocR family regulator
MQERDMTGYRGPADTLRYRVVEQRIQELIEAGTLAPGAKAPSLRETARIAGVSLSTASQAYAILEQRGILEARSRSGYFVRRMPVGLPAAGGPARQDPEVKEVRRGELVRRAMALMGRQDVLPLGLAQVDPQLLPGRDMGRILAAVHRRDPARCANYGPVAGCIELRRQIARRLSLAGVSAVPEELITTCGATEGLYLTLRALTHPGDTVLIATPTYHFFLQMIEVLGLRVIEIPSHPLEGIDVRELEAVLDRFPIAACVLSPTWNNPDGSLLPSEGKRRLVDALTARSVPLVEDDVYGDITFHGPRPPACKSFDRQGAVTMVSSFSKALAPGYRTGYILPGRGLGSRLLELKGMSTFASVTTVELAVAEFLDKGLYERHLLRLNRALHEQTEAMRDAVARHFPSGTKATHPRGGFMLWVELPVGAATGTTLYHLAAAEGIGISPGMLFGMTDRFDRFVRLTCGMVMTERVDRAMRRLGQLAAG